MIASLQNYRLAYGFAITLHCLLLFFLVYEHSSARPVLVAEQVNEPGRSQPIEAPVEPIKATSVDNRELMEAVNRLKAERAAKARAEMNQQRALREQAEAARRERLQEQQRIAKLKEEAAQLALKRQKAIEEEQVRMKQLAKKKEEEKKQLALLQEKQAILKKKQQAEKEKLAQIQKEKEAALAKSKLAEEARQKAELAQKQKAAAAQAALEAERNARIAGEVDKYKALIIGAISHQWILPENANRQLSSQFRIRLAPNGAVLEVNLTRSSGDPILDRSAQAAIYKASPLPVPSDAATFNLFRDISLTVRPENARG